jgi:hypothetical protein
MFLVFSWIAAAAIVAEMVVIVKILRSIFNMQKKRHPTRMAASPVLNK